MGCILWPNLFWQQNSVALHRGQRGHIRRPKSRANMYFTACVKACITAQGSRDVIMRRTSYSGISMPILFPVPVAHIFGCCEVCHGRIVARACDSAKIAGSDSLYRLMRMHMPECFALGDMVRKSGSPYSTRAPNKECPIMSRICCVPGSLLLRNSRSRMRFRSMADNLSAYRSFDTS